MSDTVESLRAQIEQMKLEQSNALSAAQAQIIKMHNTTMDNEADKQALVQSVNELLQANIALRSKMIVNERLAHNNRTERDAKLKDLTNRLNAVKAPPAPIKRAKK